MSTLRTTQSTTYNHRQSFQIVWLDKYMNNSSQTYEREIERIEKKFNKIKKFIDSDECVNYITDVNNVNIILITSGTLGKNIVPRLYDMKHIEIIYIFCGDTNKHEEWTKNYSKIKGLYMSMKDLSNTLEKTLWYIDNNIFAMGFVNRSNDITSESLDQFDQIFVCGQILKEILLSNNLEKNDMINFITYLKKTLVNYEFLLEDKIRFEKDYQSTNAIQWYMGCRQLSSIINHAFTNFDVECIMKIEFFIRDLHQHITQVYVEQSTKRLRSYLFLMHCSQSLSMDDFHCLEKAQGGLILFMNFLLTNGNRNISLNIARRTLEDSSDTISVLFVINIDPLISTTPFVDIHDIGLNQQNRDILFSICSIFRIETMRKLDENDRLWEVTLSTIDNKDLQLSTLIEHIRNETYSHFKGWHRLGDLFITLKQFDKAQQVFKTMRTEQSDIENAVIYRKLGMIKEKQQQYDRAIHYYEKSLEINKQILSPTDLNLSNFYIDLGRMYAAKNDYQQAIINFKQGLIIQEKHFPPHHPDLAMSYQNLGNAYYKLQQYDNAISYQQKVFTIYKEILPSDHLDLAKMASDISDTYMAMNEYITAIKYLEFAIEIGQSSQSIDDLLVKKWHRDLDSIKQNSKATSVN